MALTSTTNIIRYNGNTVTTVFAYPFKIFNESHIRVYVDGALKTITTHYSVSGVGEANGGNVTMLVAPGTGTNNVTIQRTLSIMQESEYPEGSKFPTEQVSNDLDLRAMVEQQLAEVDTRALVLPVVDGSSNAELPVAADRANMFLAFDAMGDPIMAAGTSGDLGPVTAFIDTLLDDVDAATARATLGVPGDVDTVFRVVGSADATKKLALEVDGFTTGTTRTLTPPDQDLTLSNLWTGMQDFRLSLTTGVPVTTADVTGASAQTIYAVPYRGNRIALYDGTTWKLRTSAQFSLALGTLTSNKPYDVFCYDNAGTPTLEFLVWTNDTARATALTTQDGILVKTGATTRRYLGTFYTASTTATEDSLAKRYLWNYDHRVSRPMKVIETTNSWTYNTATFRQANGAAANQLDYIQGVSEAPVSATVIGLATHGTQNILVSVGVGVDSTTVNSADVGAGMGLQTGARGTLISTYRGFPGVGRHTLVWLEKSDTTVTTTFYGDDVGAYTQSGITGEVWG